MRLIAQKPCSFEGKKFYIGDEIPASYVKDPKGQEQMGIIAVISSEDGVNPPEEMHTQKIGEINVPIRAKEGDLILCVTNEELTVFTDILQIGTSKKEDKQKISEMIQKIESEDLLIMLDALDGRTFVKEESQKRAGALTPEPDADGEDSGINEEPEGEEEPQTPEPDEEPGGDE